MSARKPPENNPSNKPPAKGKVSNLRAAFETPQEQPKYVRPHVEKGRAIESDRKVAS